VQGSLHSQVLAAKAVCLGEALRDDFKIYAAQVKANAQVLAETIAGRCIRIVSGGTDTHIVLVDLSSKGLLGRDAERVLARANITSNKNPIPNDSPRPMEWVGMRLGVAAATTRGMKESEFRMLGDIIADLIDAESAGQADGAIERASDAVAELTQAFPIYGN
jgi:glycine hydroxymethyltransferase